MSKPKIPNQRKANINHKKRVERYAKLIQEAYDRMAQEMSRIASIAEVDPDVQFSFADYPLTRNAISRLQNQLMQEIGGIIMAGTSEEWRESNLVQDMVARKVLTAYTGTNKFGDEYTRYFQTNPDSLKAFQQRKDEGMNLASSVWDLSEQYKEELEEAISAAMAPGMSAVELAAQVKQYLKNPGKRFRRIRDKFGNLQLSGNAKAYHPGRGVYRSSARNAQRLARTEINMAYRAAEQKRWEQFDFVVGYEVKITQNEHHIEDICDQLAGKYPKGFKFSGWHPQCMCYCIPILKTEEEFWAYDSENPVKSANEITELPSNFREWINDNKERIEAAEKRGKLPYFIRDNNRLIDEIKDSNSKQKDFKELSNQERFQQLNKHGYLTYIDFEDYDESPVSQFDFISFKRQVDEIMRSYGIEDLVLDIRNIGPHGFTFSLEADGIDIRREFRLRKGELTVYHSRFELAQSLQGKGISKAVFRELYKEYERMGVKRITVHANLDIGGYTWSRYGFCAVDMKAAINAVPYDSEAIKIIREYYKKNDLSEDKPFPMNLISDQLGKDALLHSSWEGVLNLQDSERVAKFKTYLGLK
ncbi:MAG: hypothetical protein HDS07_00540 [Bacteroides sp.]|nr:hypothetical protein [Bacteroides sp.]